MGKLLFLAVDLGTSFIKSGVYDTAGNCLTGASEPVKDHRPSPGVFIQYGDELMESVIKCIRSTSQILGERVREVAAISFTGQMAGFMGVGENWEDITTWSCSLDTRYAPYAQKQMLCLKDSFLNVSGTNAPLMCSKFEWFRREFPEKARKIAKYVMISGFVIGRMGELPVEEAVIDGSFIAWTGMADIKKKTWSREICDAIGMDMNCLPRIVQSNEVCGHLSPRMSDMTGLPSGIPLVSGAGDKVTGCVGAGINKCGDTILEAASYAGFSCMVDAARPDSEKGYFDIIGGPSVKSFLAHKYLQGSGITLDWFIHNFVMNDVVDKKSAFAKMEREADSIPPGCEGVFALGQLNGSAMPFDSSLKGMWMGHTFNHGPAHLYRALLECFAYDIGITLEQVEKYYPEYKIDSVKLIGGGAKSRLWAQMFADVTGKRFIRLDREDVALWGACILAGNAVGCFKDIHSVAAEAVHVQETFIPNLRRQEEYEPYKRIYEEYSCKLHYFYEDMDKIRN
ncbi:FGGY family carbohydrate kinase [Blautia schinkii]|nr:FGGY family carbohydrate kinase [Blautia schinkii]